MAGMNRALIIAAALGLTACAASSPSDAPAAAPAEQPTATPSEPDFSLATDMNCNATAVVRCPAMGCAAGQAGEAMEQPISIHVPRAGGTGSFCLATGCEDAVIEPTLTRALGWTAIVRTNERTHKNAELTIARDRTFTLRDAGSMSIMTWTGTCDPAGS